MKLLFIMFLLGREEIEWTEKALRDKEKKFPPTVMKVDKRILLFQKYNLKKYRRRTTALISVCVSLTTKHHLIGRHSFVSFFFKIEKVSDSFTYP